MHPDDQEPTATTWPDVVRAAVYGFVFAGGLLLATPRAPWPTLVLVGVVVGLFLEHSPRWATILSLALGAGMYILAGRHLPHLAQSHVHLAGLALPLVGLAALRLARRLLSRRSVTLALAALVCLLFVAGAAGYVAQVAVRVGPEPRAETYAYDPFFFVKTYYLVERHGMDFYQAYGLASIQDARFDKPISNLAGWRTPALTTLWTVLFDSSYQIIIGFIVFAAASMVLAYFTAARLADPVVALIVPALLSGYYVSALLSLHFLAYEVWAGFFALAAACLVTYGREPAGLVCALGAGIIREWYVSVLLAGIAHNLWRRRRGWALVWAGGLVLVLVVYALNVWRAREYLLSMGIQPSSGQGGRVGGGGPLFILYTLQFNARLYAHTYVVPYLAFFLGLAGCAALLRRGQPFVPTLVLVPLAFFLVVGSGHRPGDPYGMDVYYSGAFLPFSMIAAACADQLLRTRRTGNAIAER